MIVDAQYLQDKNLTPLLDPRFLPALEKVLAKTVTVLALNKNEIRLLVNKEIGEPILTVQAWTRIWNDNAGIEIKVSEYYQQIRDLIETRKAEAKMQLVENVYEAENYLELNRSQYLLNQIHPGISKEPVDTVQSGNVTIIVAAPKDLPSIPKDSGELALSADQFADYELISQQQADNKND